LKAQILLSLALKILGIKYGIDALLSVPQAIFFLYREPPLDDPYLGYKYWSILLTLNPLYLLGISLIAIFKSDRIAGFLCRRKEEIKEPSVDLESVQYLLVIGLKIIGVLTLLDAIPSVSRLIALGWTYKGGSFKYFDTSSTLDLASHISNALLFIGIGFYIIFRTDKIYRLLTGRSAPSKLVSAEIDSKD